MAEPAIRSLGMRETRWTGSAGISRLIPITGWMTQYSEKPRRSWGRRRLMRRFARRLPRTFAAAYALAAALDADLAKAAKPVAVPAARRALEKVQAAWGGGDG